MSIRLIPTSTNHASSKVFDSASGAKALLANIQDLAPNIASRAVEIETARRIPADMVDALKTAGTLHVRPAKVWRVGTRTAGRARDPCGTCQDRRSIMAPLRERRRVFHGLRKSSVVFLLEGGCTDAEVSAITGQSREMVEHYAQQANQRKLAAAAILKWEAATQARTENERDDSL